MTAVYSSSDTNAIIIWGQVSDRVTSATALSLLAGYKKYIKIIV